LIELGSEQEAAMLKRLAVLAAGLALSAPVLADREWRHERDNGYRYHDRHHSHGHYDRHYPRRFPIIIPPPRVYVPAPIFVPPARVYAPPAPVFYRPIVPHSGISVRLHFPL
jgi:hypothetical protein